MSASLELLAKIKTSDGWIFMRRYIEAEINKSLSMLEETLDIDQTNLERGKIRAYRTMLRDVEQNLTDHPEQPVPYAL